jgi:kelch-like protein 12
VSILFTGVQKACCEFLEHQLDPSNCLGIKSFAETHSCEELKSAAETFIHKHFTEIVKSEEFMTLDAKDIINLIKSDNLTVSLLQFVQSYTLAIDRISWK